MKARLSISSKRCRTIDAAAATLRVEARDKFRHDLIAWLELNCPCHAPTNDDIAHAITACLGITQTTRVYLCDGANTITGRRQIRKQANEQNSSIQSR